MNRREFLKYSAIAAAAAAVPAGGCVTLSAPVKPARYPLLPGESLLLANGRLVDVEAGEVVHPAHILLRGKTVAEVFHGPERPRADKVMDLAGMYVMPGLINNHCHITLPGIAGIGWGVLRSIERQVSRNAEECLRHGVTTVRDMLGHPGAIDDLKAAIARGTLLGPRIYRSSAVQVPGGYLAVFSLVGGERAIRSIGSPGEARDAVKRARDGGADFIKAFLQYRQLWLPGNPLPVLDDGELAAVRDEADRHCLVTALHHTTVEGFRRAMAAGIPSFEHMPVDAELTGADIEAFVARGCGIVPTASVSWSLSYRWTLAPYSDSPEVAEIIEDRAKRLKALLAEFAEEEIARSALEAYRSLSDPGYFNRRHLMLTPDPRSFNATAVIGRRNLVALARAGALLGCGNDGGTPFLFPGMMGLEMGILQRLGLRPMQVLRMATINNARILRKTSEIGSIRKGKTADLVVLSANPAEDVENLGHIEMVFFEGQLTYSTQKA